MTWTCNHLKWEEVVNGVQCIGKNLARSEEFRHALASALTAMPRDVAKAAIEKCYFVTFDTGDTKGRFVHAADLAGRSVVLIRGDLVYPEDDDQEEAIKTIMHELAHLFLDHRMTTLEEIRARLFLDHRMTVEEAFRHEDAAIRVAADWFETWRHIQGLYWKLCSEEEEDATMVS